jgi:NADP-dependent aldehyde dehydrogenase
MPTFTAASPATGRPLERSFDAATPEQVDRACRHAAAAFDHVSDDHARASLLREAASGIAALGDRLLETASAETGLAPPRLAGERDRTVFTLRMFADLAESGAWRRDCSDAAQPERTPLPKPALRRFLLPLGPVAVFGASNFPLAYSTAGGDTASALAAGCPVVVKGHALHPATGELVASVLVDAVRKAGLHPGTFALLPAGGERDHAVGAELVTHPAIRAAGFTGSHGGGMALHRLAEARPEPIPVFAEMGSVNPVFVLPRAASSDGEAIAERLFASVSNSCGQMCTCPGLIFVPACAAASLVDRLAVLVTESAAQPMLSHGMRQSFGRRIDECRRVGGVHLLASGRAGTGEGFHQPLVLLRTDAATFEASPTLRDECFGPSTIIIECEGVEAMLAAVASLPGSLAASIFHAPGDEVDGRRLERALLRRVGRLVFNGVPTGVEVSPAMVHGGPYPATNQPHTTAVGAMAIERWCRPVCLQNHPGW